MSSICERAKPKCVALTCEVKDIFVHAPDNQETIMSLTGDRYVGTCGGHTIEERAKGTQLISMMSCVIAILYIRHDDDAVRRSQPLEEAQPRGHATASAKVIEATTINS